MSFSFDTLRAACYYQVMENTYYTVIVPDGEVCDRDLRPIRPAPRAECGHKHRTEKAAERCHNCLRQIVRNHWTGRVMTESATWYNAIIVQLDANGEYLRSI
jgi:hypothetical protein